MPGAVYSQLLAPATRGRTAFGWRVFDAKVEAEMGGVTGRKVRKRQACRGMRHEERPQRRSPQDIGNKSVGA